MWMCVLAGLGCSKLAGAIDLDSRACSGGRGAMNMDQKDVSHADVLLMCVK